MTTRKDGIWELERSGKITERSIKHHASETVRSTNPAGGPVDPKLFQGKAPTPPHRANDAVAPNFNKGDAK